MRSEKLWDSLANKWDKPGVSLGETDKELIKRTRQYPGAGGKVLDYGCATGSVVFELARTAKECHGVDISANMVNIAKAKAADTKAANVSFIHGTIFNEGLKKESYDVITAFSILHLVEDAPQVFQRINQLLKPGGLFISATPSLGTKKPLSILLSIPVFLARITRVLPHVNFFSANGLAKTITTQNFRIVEQNNLNAKGMPEVYIAAEKG
jgi:2-polyprenyl-3-methyl-5-hydroxy-6-metoxy-1,4-benzoquinol methylase